MRSVLRGVRAICVGLLAASAAGCVTDSEVLRSGYWVIDQHPDRITGTPSRGAYTMAARASTSTNPLLIVVASVQLTCFDAKPIAKFAFNLRVGADRNTSLGYRFDDKPGHDGVESRVLFGQQVIVVEDGAAVKQFVEDLRGSTLLYVRIRSLNAGTTVAEFRTAGNEAALDAAYAACAVPASATAPAPRRTS